MNIIEITAVSGSFNAKESVRFEILSNPDLSISDVKYPQKVSYGENFKFDVLLNVKVPVNDVHLFINDLEVFKIDFMEGSKKASMKFNSENLYKKNNVTLRVDFKDKNGKQYSINKDYPVTITDVPFLLDYLVFSLKSKESFIKFCTYLVVMVIRVTRINLDLRNEREVSHNDYAKICEILTETFAERKKGTLRLVLLNL